MHYYYKHCIFFIKMVHPVQLLSTTRRVDLSLQKSSLMVLIYLKAFKFLKLTFIHDSREIHSREQLVKKLSTSFHL